MGFRDFVDKLVGDTTGLERLTGPPTSSNGASSHHLFWRIDVDPEDPVVEVGVEIEVIEPPTVPRLFFWALQASFAEHGVVTGAGHFGLQFHPDYPGNGAVNWGGYYSRSSGRTGELHGSPLAIPSALGNPNTGDYPWRPGARYRYRIRPTPDGAWRGSITDVEVGKELVVRDLYCLGDSLTDIVMWTEAFADCDAPPTAVRWSHPAGLTRSGRRLDPTSVLVHYQPVHDGGCSTSNSEHDAAGVVQRTGVVRTVPAGTEFAL